MKSAATFLLSQLLLAGSAFASFEVLDSSAHINTSTGVATFSIDFNEPADLSTYDEFGRAAKTFQVFVYGNESLGYPDYFSAILRTAEGPETASNVLLARASRPLTEEEMNDPLSGGWGRVLESTPITFSGNSVSFSLTNALINLQPDSAFKYYVMATEYGSTYSATPEIYATIAPTAIPEVSTSAMMLLGMVSLAAFLKRKTSMENN
jgi:hypothetical protein